MGESQGGAPPSPQSSACIKQYSRRLVEKERLKGNLVATVSKHCSGVFVKALQHPGARRSLPEDPDVRRESTQPLTALAGPKHSFTVGGRGAATWCGNCVCGRRQLRQRHWASSSEQSLNPNMNCASAVGSHTPRLATTSSSRRGSSSTDRLMEIAVIVVVNLLMR